MAESAPATPKEMIAIGCIASAAGVYFLLVGAGVPPVSGGPDNLHGPAWIVLCAGLAFFLAGAALFLQVIGRANDQGKLPPDAASWTRVVQYLIGVAIFASFGAIGSWIAFGPGDRAFSGSISFGGDTGASIGRIAFGVGTVIIWLCTIAFAVSGARKLFSRRESGQK